MQSDSSSPPNPSAGQRESQQTGQPQQSGQNKQQTPEGPRDGEKPGEQNPQQKDGDDPKNNQHSEDTSPKAPAGQNPEYATEDPNAPGADAEVWGNLPIHLRDIFRAEGGQDMPAQYRDWIDNYYRRLNDRSGN